ncbi:uncharacterized protein BT62DRAFT_1013234 [Guyanagaster necrorhizus]|uniref:Uncharacterized protein n=1 Tax=Guyanagaster necrorhizus TaxID=856835 RepID=A0A9P7VGJ0_9AGAR|nr:uncharacterized protein BT62DRAFT_1013234 [Guyanagaster necrorhizus MCA 3950]KAG7439980.1 hypothetical protein BT62DRAFT_1013234 [Guyanagaster necrorhizus MCA 3950]
MAPLVVLAPLTWRLKRILGTGEYQTNNTLRRPQTKLLHEEHTRLDEECSDCVSALSRIHFIPVEVLTDILVLATEDPYDTFDLRNGPWMIGRDKKPTVIILLHSVRRATLPFEISGRSIPSLGPCLPTSRDRTIFWTKFNRQNVSEPIVLEHPSDGGGGLQGHIRCLRKRSEADSATPGSTGSQHANHSSSFPNLLEFKQTGGRNPRSHLLPERSIRYYLEFIQNSPNLRSFDMTKYASESVRETLPGVFNSSLRELTVCAPELNDKLTLTSLETFNLYIADRSFSTYVDKGSIALHRPIERSCGSLARPSLCDTGHYMIGPSFIIDILASTSCLRELHIEWRERSQSVMDELQYVIMEMSNLNASRRPLIPRLERFTIRVDTAPTEDPFVDFKPG